MRDIEDASALQDMESKAVQQWVRKHNKNTRKLLDKTATYRRINKECRLANKKNKSLDEIWLGENGTYERISGDLFQEIKKESYLSENPQWETLLNIKTFAKKEGENWEFSDIFQEKFNKKIVTMIGFSNAGSDAFIAREFNVKTKKFVRNGFSLPMAHSDITWYSHNTLLLGTNFGENSLTEANYSRSLRLLKRGQPFEKATTVFEIDSSHMMATSHVWHTKGKRYLFYVDCIDLYHSKFYLVSKKNPKHYHCLPIPMDAHLVDILQDTALIQLNSDWQVDEEMVFRQNAIVGLDLLKFRKNPDLKASMLNVRLWYQANSRSKIEKVFSNEDSVYIFVINNLQKQLLHVKPLLKSFRLHEIPIPLDYSHASPAFSNEEGELFFYFETFLQPKTLYAYNPNDASLKIIHQGSHYFNAADYLVRRMEATSKDGAIVPYHIVMKRGLQFDGLNPTILRAYGGFNDFLNPTYLKHKSIALLDKGFTYVHATIRGGGEFGEQWHQQGSLTYKQNSFNDFISVAEDLIQLKITSPNYLGIQGESNGGLLVAACVIQRPELFSAVFCDVAVLDMLHYHKLFVGKSWVAEYGNPDDSNMHQALQKYSPLHNISAEKKYPKLFIQSSKTDDRVHPYHARAMVHQLQQLKKPVFYLEKKDGGHTGSTFEEYMRIYTYWHLRLLIPAQRERKRQREEKSPNSAGFFQVRERHTPHRRLERSNTYAAAL